MRAAAVRRETPREGALSHPRQVQHLARSRAERDAVINTEAPQQKQRQQKNNSNRNSNHNSTMAPALFVFGKFRHRVRCPAVICGVHQASDCEDRGKSGRNPILRISSGFLQGRGSPIARKARSKASPPSVCRAGSRTAVAAVRGVSEVRRSEASATSAATSRSNQPQKQHSSKNRGPRVQQEQQEAVGDVMHFFATAFEKNGIHRSAPTE